MQRNYGPISPNAVSPTLLMRENHVALGRWSSADDAAQRVVVAILSDPAALEQLPYAAVHTPKGAQEFLKKFEQNPRDEGHCYGVYLHSVDTEPEPVGLAIIHTAGPQAHIGYALAPTARGKGVGSALVRLLVRYVFTNWPAVSDIGAGTTAHNPASVRVLQKGGFREPAGACADGSLMFELRRSDWVSSLCHHQALPSPTTHIVDVDGYPAYIKEWGGPLWEEPRATMSKPREELAVIVPRMLRGICTGWAVSAAGFALGRLLVRYYDVKGTRSERLYVAERLPSAVHALVTSVRAMQLVLRQGIYSKNALVPFPAAVDQLLSFSAGYQIHDMSIMALDGAVSWDVWVHHFFGAGGAILVMFYRMGAITPVLHFISELTVLPQNVLTVSRIVLGKNFQKTRTHALLLWLRLLTHVCFRIGIGPLCVWYMFGARSGMSWSEASRLPFFFKSVTTFQLLLFTLLNVNWFRAVLRAALKTTL